MNSLSKFALTGAFVGLLGVLWVWALPALDGLIQRLVACCGPFAAADGGERHAPGAVDLASLQGAPIDGPRRGVDDAPRTTVVPLARKRTISADVRALTFAEISNYDYILPDPYAKEPQPEAKDQIPDEVLALSGLKVSLEGYMLPIKVEGNRVKSFMLSRYAGGCCFGRAAMMNELVIVEMDEATEYIPHAVVLVIGEFEVGEAKDEYGYVTSLYRMQGTEVE